MTTRKGRRRTLTPAAIARQQLGGGRVNAWCWFDREGVPHVSVPELLAERGLPNTPAGREEATRVIAAALRDLFPGVEIVIQDEGTDG